MNSVLLSQRHTDVLAEFVETLSCEHTLAIVLAGSAVNGTASRYSDLDLAHIVDAAYTGPEKKFYYRGPQLVSVTARTIGWWELAVERPERALFVVPAMRSARILFDPHGIFARYQANLASFSWASL